MKHLLKIVFCTLLFPGLSLATEMSDDLSRCFGMKDIVSSHDAWKSDYYRFKDASVKLDFNTKFNVSFNGAKKIVSNIEKLKQASGLNDKDVLLDEAHRLFKAIDTHDITHSSALPVLQKGMGKLLDDMNHLIYEAEVKTKCQLSPQPIGIVPNTSKTAQ